MDETTEEKHHYRTFSDKTGAMIIERYGLTLREMTEEDLETVLNWRNNPELNQYFFNRHRISWEEHWNWFQSFNPNRELYFIIVHEGKSTGLLWFTNIDYEQEKCESNCYTGDVNLIYSNIAGYLMLLTGEVPFQILGLRSFYGKVLKNNKQYANMLKRHIGVESDPSISADTHDTFIVGKEEFLRKTAKFRKAAVALTDCGERIRVFFSNEELNNPAYRKITRQMQERGHIESEEQTTEGVWYRVVIS